MADKSTTALINETLLMFASAKTQLEGGRQLLNNARSTLARLGGCDDEITKLDEAIRRADVALARIEPKLRYVSTLNSTAPVADVLSKTRNTRSTKKG